LFAKIEDAQIQAQLDKLQATKLANANESSKVFDLEPLKPNISFEDFLKMDMRIGVVMAAEKMPKTKKLLVLKVKVGDEIRSIVSGIAMDHDPESIIGQKVTVLCNLKPRNLRGVESQGMILMTKSKDGSLVFVQPDAAQNTVSGLKVS
jgi:methionyl-tRNA synthetase